jgi:hypothetical protein
MSDLFNPKNEGGQVLNKEPDRQFSEKSIYVKEDDQDWGSAGMNDIQPESVK